MKKMYPTRKICPWKWALSAMAVLIVFGFSGCALGLPTGGDGGVGVTLPRGILAKADGDFSYEIYVYKDNSLFRGPISGTLAYQEESENWKGEREVPNLPVGGGYQIMVLLHHQEEPEPGMYEDRHYYLASEPVTVKKDQSTPVTFGEQDQNWYFKYKFLGGAENPPVTSVAVLENWLAYAVSDGSLFGQVEPGDLGMQKIEVGAGGLFVNSVSVLSGYYIPVANTESGLWINDYEGFELIPLAGSGEEPDIRRSAFSSDSLFAAQGFLKNSGINALYFGEMQEPGQLGTTVTVNLGLAGRNVTDLLVYADYYEELDLIFAATDFAGAFCLDVNAGGFLEGPDELSFDDVKDNVFGYLPLSDLKNWNSAINQVISLGLIKSVPSGSSLWGLYIGTDNGLYRGGLDADGIASGFDDETPPVLVPGTAGLKIRKIIVADQGYYSPGAACLTSSGVILLNGAYEQVARIPFLEHLVGEVTDIGLISGRYGASLYVAGKKGMVEIDVGRWFPYMDG